MSFSNRAASTPPNGSQRPGVEPPRQQQKLLPPHIHATTGAPSRHNGAVDRQTNAHQARHQPLFRAQANDPGSRHYQPPMQSAPRTYLPPHPGEPSNMPLELASNMRASLTALESKIMYLLNKQETDLLRGRQSISGLDARMNELCDKLGREKTDTDSAIVQLTKDFAVCQERHSSPGHHDNTSLTLRPVLERTSEAINSLTACLLAATTCGDCPSCGCALPVPGVGPSIDRSRPVDPGAVAASDQRITLSPSRPPLQQSDPSPTTPARASSSTTLDPDEAVWRELSPTPTTCGSDVGASSRVGDASEVQAAHSYSRRPHGSPKHRRRDSDHRIYDLRPLKGRYGM